eukprot:CAMPEP_0180315144 /NCGR_PEP_ID=MMETSP0988-20121125/32475_1 /TAXON_ID=697907 /ORGANISM="non described non described, Strain CCMP2293" /LENGTH=82 /DNA_ID=CAMNT_0022299969 /DNA_START=326 /DNA_END=570 /DNA_ORIENTATION=+
MEMLTTSMLGQKDGVCNSMPGWDPLNIWSVRNPSQTPSSPTAVLGVSRHTDLQRNPCSIQMWVGKRWTSGPPACGVGQRHPS